MLWNHRMILEERVLRLELCIDWWQWFRHVTCRTCAIYTSVKYTGYLFISEPRCSDKWTKVY